MGAPKNQIYFCNLFKEPTKMKRLVLLLIVCLPVSILAQKFAGLAPTPADGLEQLEHVRRGR